MDHAKASTFSRYSGWIRALMVGLGLAVLWRDAHEDPASSIDIGQHDAGEPEELQTSRMIIRRLLIVGHRVIAAAGSASTFAERGEIRDYLRDLATRYREVSAGLGGITTNLSFQTPLSLPGEASEAGPIPPLTLRLRPPPSRMLRAGPWRIPNPSESLSDETPKGGQTTDSAPVHAVPLPVQRGSTLNTGLATASGAEDRQGRLRMACLVSSLNLAIHSYEDPALRQANPLLRSLIEETLLDLLSDREIVRGLVRDAEDLSQGGKGL